MSRLIEVIRHIVQQELARRRGSQLGIVTATFPHAEENDENNYEVNVRLKHDDLELRRVPVSVSHMGVAASPRVGDLVLVQFMNDDLNQPLVTSRFYHADERSPLYTDNEILFEQRVPDGTLNHLRFTDNGTIYLQRNVTTPKDNSDAKATIHIDGKSGDLEITSGTDAKGTIHIDGKSGDLKITSGTDAKGMIHIDGKSGDLEISSGEKVLIRLTHDAKIEITAEGHPIAVTCKELTVTGNATVNGDLKVSSNGQSTTISGNQIKGA